MVTREQIATTYNIGKISLFFYKEVIFGIYGSESMLLIFIDNFYLKLYLRCYVLVFE